MATFGSIGSATDTLAKAVRTGTVSVIITDTTKSITFSSSMPSANYRVFLSLESNLAVVLWPTSKTSSGFTLNLSVGVSGSVAWLAIED